ncbi:nuclear transport factor 2 family protein [Pinirhizobacter soli]|uniref:nuclear transport factor 2 family protein n=1 Tax=Pinirhizobacter soli TaxID=2786953 RepID=UPI00202A2860|nr:nuclear transport factor 2 family protein [Pinirhizobacter soli]
MRAASLTWILVGAWFVLSAHAEEGVGDYRGLPPDLATAATAYDVAQTKADRAGLERYLADDYTLANLDGGNRTKGETIAAFVAPGSKTTYVAISQQVSKVWSDGAALGGIVDAKGIDHGKPFTLHARFVDVWAKRGGQWQVIFTQIHNAPTGK